MKEVPRDLERNTGQPPSAYLNANPPWEDTTRSLIRCWFGQWAWTRNLLPSTSANPGAQRTRLPQLPLTMTRNRQKTSERSTPATQDDAAKKSQKSGGSEPSGPAPQGPPRSGGCLGPLVTAVFYVALLGAAGFGGFHVQQAVEEIRQTNTKHEESARQSAELSAKMESVVQQVESLRSVVDGLESSLGITRVELEGAVSRLKRGEVETRRVEEALQRLQNDLLRDLSEGIKEVKEAREEDFSSLEKTVEERLAEVSQSIRASVVEFTKAQGESQSQLADLRARLGDTEDPALIKQELSAIVDAVAEIKTTKEAADASLDSLRDQIGSVREELQTRNDEVASLSQEVEVVRTVMQSTSGKLRESLSETEAGLKTLKDKTAELESKVEQVADAVHNVKEETDAAAAQAQKQSDDLEARLKALEESADSLSASVSEVSAKTESLLTRYDTHESTVAAQGEAVQKVQSNVRQELEEVKSTMQELEASIATLGGAQTELASTDSSLGERVEGLERSLAVLEDSSSRMTPEQLESLQNMVAGLESKAAKLEGHGQAISALQEALQKTTESLAGLSDVPIIEEE